MKCRHCQTDLIYDFVDLGFAPPSNAYLTQEDLSKPEEYYPLKVKVCHECWLVQTEDYNKADELFNSNYAYFSSTSTTWLKHAKSYVNMITKRLNLSNNSLVMEIASNDGYLLTNFVEKGIPCIGIEPTKSTAIVAEAKGIAVIQDFFGVELANQFIENIGFADLVIGNNVFAHVPKINDFTKALKIVLKPSGVVTLEFPHLKNLVKLKQFDTIYHEHYSYLSLFTVCKIFQSAGLRVFDVEEIETHGGSLRVYGCHDFSDMQTTKNVLDVLNDEKRNGLQDLTTYSGFQNFVNIIKNDFLSFLIQQYNSGKIVAAYGAAAKGNTLINYAGIKTDFIKFVCDAAISKQKKFLPGSHIPILHPSTLENNHVDFVIIFPWNITKEVKQQLSYLENRGTKFVTLVPTLKIYE